MSEQEKKYYLGVKGKKLGPVSEHDIQRLYNEKKITGDVLFARTGDKGWIPLSQSGIITIEPVDNLPPLPTENKTVEIKPNETNSAKMQSTKTEGTVKKSKLGYIAAGLGVAVVASVVFVVVMFNNMGNTSNVPVGAITQGSTDENSPPITTAPPVGNEATDEAAPVGSSDFEFSTFRIPYSNIGLDYPSHFTYERTDGFDHNNIMGFGFTSNNQNHSDNHTFMINFSRPMEFDTNIMDFVFVDTATLDTESMIRILQEAHEDENADFELLGRFTTSDGSGFYYRSELFGSRIAAYYENHGFFDAMGNSRIITIVIMIPINYVDDYEEYFQIIIGSLRYLEDTVQVDTDEFNQPPTSDIIATDLDFDLAYLGERLRASWGWNGLDLEQPESWILEVPNNIRFTLGTDELVEEVLIYNPQITIDGTAWNLTPSEIRDRFDVLYEDFGQYHAIGTLWQYYIITFFIETNVTEFVSIRMYYADAWAIEESPEPDSQITTVQVDADIREFDGTAESLIGIWRRADAPRGTVTLRADGTFLTSAPRVGGLSPRGRWELHGDMLHLNFDTIIVHDRLRVEGTRITLVEDYNSTLGTTRQWTDGHTYNRISDLEESVIGSWRADVDHDNFIILAFHASGDFSMERRVRGRQEPTVLGRWVLNGDIVKATVDGGLFPIEYRIAGNTLVPIGASIYYRRLN